MKHVRCAMCDVRWQAACGLAVLVFALFAGGCESYALRGRVVAGPKSQVLVVNQDDPRLTGPGALPGVEDAEVSFMLDPAKAGHKYLGATTTATDGAFDFPVDEIGAGFLEYGLGVTGRAANKAPAYDETALPSGNKRLLIMLAPGRDRPLRQQDDPMGDIDKYMPK